MSATPVVGRRVRLSTDEDVDWGRTADIRSGLVKPWSNRTGVILKILWTWKEPQRQNLTYEEEPDVLVVLDGDGDEVEINVDLLRDLTPLELLALEAQ